MSQAHSGQRRSREHRAAISAGVRQHLQSKQHEKGGCVPPRLPAAWRAQGCPPPGVTRRRCPPLSVHSFVDRLYLNARNKRGVLPRAEADAMHGGPGAIVMLCYSRRAAAAVDEDQQGMPLPNLWEAGEQHTAPSFRHQGVFCRKGALPSCHTAQAWSFAGPCAHASDAASASASSPR